MSASVRSRKNRSNGSVSPTKIFIPPLENGDRLPRDEFERRYEAMPKGTRAELIQGTVYMPSPVRHEAHSEPHQDLDGLIAVYRFMTPGVRGGIENRVRLDLQSEPQPDMVLFIDPRLGGNAQIDEDDYISGGPELVCEISSSTVSLDLGPKLESYRANGIQEYFVWRVLDKEVDWFVLRRNRYQKQMLTNAVLKCKVFPGLWIDVESLLGNTMQRALEVLQEGIASPEHTRFVAELKARAKQ